MWTAGITSSTGSVTATHQVKDWKMWIVKTYA